MQPTNMMETANHLWIFWAVAAIPFAALEYRVRGLWFGSAAVACLFASYVACRNPIWEIPFAAFTFGTLIGIFLIRPTLVTKFAALKRKT